MNNPDLVAEGMAAAFDPDDLETALSGPLEDRKRALMRLIAGAYKRGWDECNDAYIKGAAELLEPTTC